MEDENFNVIAQSRANYYTPGSPVQFVRVELLRGDQSGENAVCLSFRNIAPETVTGLKVRFKCKDGAGSVLCEDTFDYEDLKAQTGDVFGMDDAVFITPQDIGSVDVVLLQAQFGRKTAALENYKRVRLPAPKRLPKDLAARLQAQVGRPSMKYMPQILENGWYCACGAFHSNEEDTVYCSECGSDRILLQNAVSNLIQPAAPAEEPTRVAEGPVDEPTRVAQAGQHAFAQAQPAAQASSSTREVSGVRAQNAEPYPNPYKGAAAEHFQQAYRAPAREDTEEPEEDPRDVAAENIIRWVPPITALLCALIALGGFVYCQLIL